MAGDEFGFDLDPIIQAIDAADVIVIRFAFAEQRLLIDVRPSDNDAPVIALVPQASAIEERFRTVKQARPGLPVPDRIVSFQWPRHAALLEAAGIWGQITRRVAGTGFAAAAQRCDEAWQALAQEERREERRAVRGGERYETLWEKTPSTDA